LKIFISASCCAFIFAGALGAQNLLDRFTFNAGGGINETEFNTNKNVTGGWNAQAGAGYKFTPHLWVSIDAQFDRLRITQAALNSLATAPGFPSGRVRDKAVMLDPSWHFRPKARWDYYVFGGGGAFQRLQQLASPTLAVATGTNPFFGFNSPGYPLSDIKLAYTVTKPGVDVGVGTSFNARWNVKVYLEAKYEHVFMGSLGHMDYVPVSVGFRW
jgi:hypothetical protein